MLVARLCRGQRLLQSGRKGSQGRRKQTLPAVSRPDPPLQAKPTTAVENRPLAPPRSLDHLQAAPPRHVCPGLGCGLTAQPHVRRDAELVGVVPRPRSVQVSRDRDCPQRVSPLGDIGGADALLHNGPYETLRSCHRPPLRSLCAVSLPSPLSSPRTSAGAWTSRSRARPTRTPPAPAPRAGAARRSCTRRGTACESKVERTGRGGCMGPDSEYALRSPLPLSSVRQNISRHFASILRLCARPHTVAPVQNVWPTRSRTTRNQIGNYSISAPVGS